MDKFAVNIVRKYNNRYGLFSILRRMRKMTCIFIFTFSAVICAAQTDPVKTVTVDTGNSRDTVGIFEKVDVEAGYPGGLQAWKQFLMTNLRADAPFKDLPKKVKYFEQTAVVQFIVCTDGTICDVKVINKVLPSIRKEAERVVNNSGKWEPAEQNSKKVKAYRKQPITFVVTSV